MSLRRSHKTNNDTVLSKNLLPILLTPPLIFHKHKNAQVKKAIGYANTIGGMVIKQFEMNFCLEQTWFVQIILPLLEGTRVSVGRMSSMKT